MASDRAYRQALPLADIVAEFGRGSGQQFDPRVVEVMLQLIEQDRPHISAQAQASGQPAPESAVSGPRSWAQHMQTIEGLGQQLARTTSTEDICDLIGETVASLVPHDQCRVLLMSDDRARLDIIYMKGTDRAEYRAVTAENASVRLGEGIAGWVAESRRGVVLGDTEHHPKAAHVDGTEVIDESMLAVPVAFEDEVLAVIVVLKLGLNQFSLDQLRLLTILANQAAVSMANARLIDRLASAASVDALTGLMNRGAFEDAVNKHLLRPQSWGTLLMFDVVNLRETNVAYGHRAGDAVLKRIANAIRSSIRADDLASRWIGDNFAILAPGIDSVQGEALARRVETALQSERISILWGAAEYHGDALTAQDLVVAALKLIGGNSDTAAASVLIAGLPRLAEGLLVDPTNGQEATPEWANGSEFRAVCLTVQKPAPNVRSRRPDSDCQRASPCTRCRGRSEGREAQSAGGAVGPDCRRSQARLEDRFCPARGRPGDGTKRERAAPVAGPHLIPAPWDCRVAWPHDRPVYPTVRRHDDLERGGQSIHPSFKQPQPGCWRRGPSELLDHRRHPR